MRKASLKIRKQLSLFIFILHLSCLGWAKDQEVITIKTAVTKALKENRGLKSTKEKINQYESLVDLTRSALFPHLNLTAKMGSSQSTPGTTNPLFNGEAYSIYGSGLMLTQPLFYYGALDNISRAENDRQIQKIDLEMAERTLTVNIIAAFYKIILNETLLNNLKKNRQVLQRSLQITQHREKIGRSQRLDVLQVRTQIASLDSQIEATGNAYETAMAQLMVAMGITNGVDNSLPSMVVKGRLKSLHIKEVDGLLAQEKSYFHEMEINRLQLEQVTYGKNVVAGKYLPTLDLTSSYNLNSSTSSGWPSQNNNSWNALLTLTIPLFQGFASQYDRANYLSQENQLEWARKDLEQSLKLNKTMSRQSLKTAEASLVSAVEADRLAQESLTEATRLYQLATIDFLQYLTIQMTALTASSSLDQIRYTGIISCADYFVASGYSLNLLVDMLSEGD